MLYPFSLSDFIPSRSLRALWQHPFESRRFYGSPSKRIHFESRALIFFSPDIREYTKDSCPDRCTQKSNFQAPQKSSYCEASNGGGFHRHLQNVVIKQASTFLTHGTDAGQSANNHIKEIKTALGQNSGVAKMSRNIRDSIVHTIPLSGTGNIQCTNGYYRTQALTIMLTRKKKRLPSTFFSLS